MQYQTKNIFPKTSFYWSKKRVSHHVVSTCIILFSLLLIPIIAYIFLPFPLLTIPIPCFWFFCFFYLWVLFPKISAWIYIKSVQEKEPQKLLLLQEAKITFPVNINQVLPLFPLYHTFKRKYAAIMTIIAVIQVFICMMSIKYYIYGYIVFLEDRSLANTLFFGFLFLLFLVLSIHIAILFMHQNIFTIHTHGIKDSAQQLILWECAQWFICYRQKGLLNIPVMYWELLDNANGALWCTLIEPQPWYSLLRPTIAKAKYAQQMQDLVEYICARTGLPLYDLSGPEPIQVYPPLEQMEVALPQEQQKEDKRATDQAK